MDKRETVTERRSDKLNEKAFTGEIRIDRHKESERETDRLHHQRNGKHLPTR